MEEQRINRIDRAMSDKLQKLTPYQLKGYETLLILDDTDYALSDSMTVEETVIALRGKYKCCLSNHIYLLTSFKDDIVEAWLLKEQERWTNEIFNRGPFYEFTAHFGYNCHPFRFKPATQYTLINLRVL